MNFSIHNPNLQNIQNKHNQHLKISKPPIQTNISSNTKNTQITNTLNYHTSINLHSTIQNNIPKPYNIKINFTKHFNIPNKKIKQYNKYIQKIHITNHPQNN